MENAVFLVFVYATETYVATFSTRDKAHAFIAKHAAKKGRAAGEYYVFHDTVDDDRDDPKPAQ
jgi:hypothetical protein